VATEESYGNYMPPGCIVDKQNGYVYYNEVNGGENDGSWAESWHVVCMKK